MRVIILLLFLLWTSTAETVSQCETTDHLITFGSVWDLSVRIKMFALPKVEIPKTADQEPAKLRMTVDSSGKVIELVQRSGSSSPELKTVMSAMSSWTFDSFQYAGRPICMRANIYVYFKDKHGSPQLIISGFTDKDRKPK